VLFNQNTLIPKQASTQGSNEADGLKEKFGFEEQQSEVEGVLVTYSLYTLHAASRNQVSSIDDRAECDSLAGVGILWCVIGRAKMTDSFLRPLFVLRHLTRICRRSWIYHFSHARTVTTKSRGYRNMTLPSSNLGYARVIRPK